MKEVPIYSYRQEESAYKSWKWINLLSSILVSSFVIYFAWSTQSSLTLMLAAVAVGLISMWLVWSEMARAQMSGFELYQTYAKGMYPFGEVVIPLQKGMHAVYVFRNPLTSFGTLTFYQGKERKGSVLVKWSDDLERKLSSLGISIQDNSFLMNVFLGLLLAALFTMKFIFMIAAIAMMVLFSRKIGFNRNMNLMTSKKLYAGALMPILLFFAMGSSMNGIPELKVHSLVKKGNFPEAIAMLKQEIRKKPTAGMLNHLAWLETTAPDPSLRNYPEAIVLSQAALNKAEGSHAIADTLACAHFGNQNIDRAKQIALQYGLSERSEQFAQGIPCSDPNYLNVQRTISSITENVE